MSPLNFKKKNNPKIESIAQYIFCSITLISLCVMVQLKIGITNSGLISFYVSEVIGLIVGLFVIIYVVKNRKILTKEQKYIIGFAILFLIFLIVDYVIRYFKIGLELKSIIVMESNLFVIGFMFMIIFKKIDRNRVIKTLSIFGAILGVLSVISFYVCLENIIFSSSYFNIVIFGHAVRTYLLTMLLPISAYNIVRSNKKTAMIIYYIHFISVCLCGLLSASRINYVLVPFVLLFSSIILHINKKVKLRKMFMCFMASLLIVFFTAPFFLRVYSQLTRIPITNQVISIFKIPYIGTDNILKSEKGNTLIKEEENTLIKEEEKKEVQKVVKNAEKSPGQSSSMRFSAWSQSIEDIKKAPLLGIGLQQYKCISNDGELMVVIQPHNFILEYILSFGIIGFLLWVAMISSPVILSLKKIKYKFWKSSAAALMICTMLYACGGAFFQPYFIYSNVMTLVYLLLGCFYVSIIENESKGNSESLVGKENDC